MPVFKIHHITRYEYDRPVTESMNAIRKYPLNVPGQETLQHDLHITHAPDVFSFTDYFGNRTGIFNILQPHRELTIESRMIVRTTGPSDPAIGFMGGFHQLESDKAGNLLLLELSQKEQIKEDKKITAIAGVILNPQDSVAATVMNCCNYIFSEFSYIKGITDVETTVDDILEHRSGVCQDFAHLMLQILRSLKIPARYVSGYICPNKNGMRGEGATHAWVEAWIPGQGWAGIDPTNNVWTTNTHVKLATGRNFKDCTPAKGMFRGRAYQRLSVYVSVGYESGQVFEEMNDVTTRFRDAPPLEDAEAAQQQ